MFGLLILLSSQGFAQTSEAIMAVQQAKIARLECLTKSLTAALDQAKLTCRYVNGLTDINGARAARCDPGETLTGGGGGGPHSAHISDSRNIDENAWHINFREQDESRTAKYHYALAVCCKIDRPKIDCK